MKKAKVEEMKMGKGMMKLIALILGTGIVIMLFMMYISFRDIPV